MRIPNNDLGCVGSILQNSAGAKCDGTGFLVGIKSLKYNDCYVYLVTTSELPPSFSPGWREHSGLSLAAN
jgi:hypothetical protein